MLKLDHFNSSHFIRKTQSSNHNEILVFLNYDIVKNNVVENFLIWFGYHFWKHNRHI